MGFDFAALERRVIALEKNRGASLRFGTVVGHGDDGGSVRVRLPDGEDMVTMPLRVLQKRTLKDQNQCLPDLNEPVACLFSGQGLEQGVVLGAHYSGKCPSPRREAQQDYVRYEDGTEIWYDRTAHKLVAKVQGDAEMEIEGHVSIKARQDVLVESKSRISLKAPVIALAGNLTQEGYDGGAATSVLRGSFTVREGGVAVPDRDVTAGRVSLRRHTHEGVESGPDTSGSPVGG